ncbi:hypothetical protein AQUCO_03000081v1 [Aquilegia coerulea]|uniref:HMA domain-containing protein n=1 Tax=Aquilegia coerulea TaxID=218851 RepID=A0A2G5D177_AQUCA|nr:hypothetical protein AQUCO_03000081v1 [Aquilegia coerulea]
MGEKKKDNKDKGGDSKKKEEKNKNEDKNKNKDKKTEDKVEKKDDNKMNPVILKVEMHCDGCAKKIVRSIKHFQGVEDVKADSSTDKITVFGKVDPVKLRENIESKTKKKVELLSAIPKKEKDSGEGEKKVEVKPEKKKEPQASTVTFKTRLHCDGCTQKIYKSVSKIKGVEAVTIDQMQDLVTVKGTMDVNELPSFLKKKYKRNIEIIPPKKNDGGGDKKEKSSDGEKKEKGGGGDQKKESHEAKVQDSMKAELTNRMEYYGPVGYGYGHGYGYGNGGYVVDNVHHPPQYGNGGFVGENVHPPQYGNGGYVVDNVHPPQLFSDENPNACSIM